MLNHLQNLRFGACLHKDFRAKILKRRGAETERNAEKSALHLTSAFLRGSALKDNVVGGREATALPCAVPPNLKKGSGVRQWAIAAEEPQTSNIKTQTANFGGGVAGAAAAFTLIEILVVIMLLTVLLLSALPAFRSARSNALRQTAAVEAAEIASAVMDYRRVYGTWPCEEEAKKGSATAITAGVDGEGLTSYDLDIGKILRVLRAEEDSLDYNPRGIAFLELSSSCYRKKDDQSDKEYAYDPWGKPYVLIMARAVNSSSKLSANVSRIEGGLRYGIQSSGDAYVIDIPEEVAVFSWGDPLSVTNSTMPTRIVGSWSMR